MASSIKSMIVFLVAAVLFMIQMIFSLVVFDDLNVSILGFGFAMMMVFSAVFAMLENYQGFGQRILKLEQVHMLLHRLGKMEVVQSNVLQFGVSVEA